MDVFEKTTFFFENNLILHSIPQCGNNNKHISKKKNVIQRLSMNLF